MLGWPPVLELSRVPRPIRAGEPVVMECGAIDAPVLRASILWLATEAHERGVDAVIVVGSLQDARHLSCMLPGGTLNELIAGNVVRMNTASLQLLRSDEVMPQARRHQVVLTIGLAPHELERVHRMSPAALCVVRVKPQSDCFG